LKVLHDIDELPSGLRYVLAIGTFDGVHRGHVRVLSALARAADKSKAVPVVLTFDPHPAATLRGKSPDLLCDPSERLELFEHMGVATAVVQHFDSIFADQSAEMFLDRITAERDLRALVLTSESAFGRDRSGGIQDARRLAKHYDYRVIEVGQLEVGGAPVSSTRLRALLAEGRLSQVQRLLGRRYSVVGTVVRGDQRGRVLGFPTANLHFDRDVALPMDGIYAVRVAWDAGDPPQNRHRRHGVASLGVRPTFETNGARILEVYLFGFDGDLYGQRLRVEFVRRLRGEKRFATTAALVKQMNKDAQRARQVLDTLP
jgi:riboflavin kinase/FMN adenylyltransferase